MCGPDSELCLAGPRWEYIFSERTARNKFRFNLLQKLRTKGRASFYPARNGRRENVKSNFQNFNSDSNTRPTKSKKVLISSSRDVLPARTVLVHDPHQAVLFSGGC
jgi:hypothetical protein